MAVTPTYPGVYVQEAPSGVRTIVGVSTSIGMFIGRASKGPINEPVRCLNFADFERAFSADTATGDLPRAARLFFANGGTDCYAMRIAEGASAARVTLQTEAGQPSLDLVAKQAGALGETIRATVKYDGPFPEGTFSIEIFRTEVDATGQRQPVELEQFRNLSMDPNSALFAEAFITQESKLVNATVNAGAPVAVDGYSQSGRPVSYVPGDPTAAGAFIEVWEAILGDDGAAIGNQFEISVDGNAYVPVDLSGIDVSSVDPTDTNTARTGLGVLIQGEIITALGAAGQVGVTVTAAILGQATDPRLADPGNETALLRITSDNQGNIRIRPGAAEDLAGPLMLGVDQGGLEVGAHAARRPASTGITLSMAGDGAFDADGNFTAPSDITALMSRDQNSITNLHFTDTADPPAAADQAIDLIDAGLAAGDPFYAETSAGSVNGNSDGVRQKLTRIRDAINAMAAVDPVTRPWTAELWGHRLAIIATAGGANDFSTFTTDPVATNLATDMTSNVRYLSVGLGGTVGFQTPATVVASDGNPPTLDQYREAFRIIDREVDLFNLMILPKDTAPAVDIASEVYGPASTFCQQRRAFLLMDAPVWDGAATAAANIAPLRIGLVTDHAAIFYPRLIISEDGRRVPVDPAGAMAGLMARTDGTRGVWKAAAGTEADIRGIVGVERNFSDGENGLINPRAINTIRVFPIGIVNWGARTMDGDDAFGSEYKYIPIRRLALFLEETLYRALTWAVFEPNDEPLWAQIRLNVGAFMHGLFRKGAFQGSKPSDAYFVKCDAETTTQSDRNLGIVNIWVGFAPLKPAEFVIIYLQQIAGKLEV